MSKRDEGTGESTFEVVGGVSRRPIRVLPDRLVGRIAAGEVVERPASVVKELLENALDAGADRIEVTVEGGPTGLLRVGDDGDGIPAGELTTAVQRHATSKLEDDDDLTGVDTLGFRGEGLAAIGAVARMRILSREAGAEAGSAIEVEGGRIGVPLPAARSIGTTVEVRDLFFNTPARRKYLKTVSGEIRGITQLVTAYAVARPGTSFHVTLDGRPALRLTAAGDLHERMIQLYGAKRVERMIPVLVEEPDVRIEGFLGAPEDSRARTGHQVFLLNGRWIQSPLLRHVVRQAYTDLIPPGRHPEAFLSVELPLREVDVNVHPTKKEVRFLRERELYPRLTALLRSRVEGHFPNLELRPLADESLPEDLERASRPYPTQQEILGLFRPGGERGAIVPFPTPAPRVSAAADAAPEPEPTLANLWQLHETYILARIQSGLLIIDQHAAHERVLYEQALRRLSGETPVSQELLFPTVVELGPDEFTVLLESHGALEKLGFHLETFGGTSVLVHAIPAGVREWKHGALLKDILDHMADVPEDVEIHVKVAQSLACHGAVKAGQRLSLKEMNELVDQLFATEKPKGDPHGRPVFLSLDLQELHRRFGRSG